MSILNKKVSPLIEYLVFGIFITIYLFFKFTYHELWKDEWQAWLMARDMGWGELMSSLYYEGHPALWYLYIKVWALFSSGSNDPLLLNLAHASIMLGVYYLLFFKFKFPFWLKALLLLGYYPFFEYGIVSRGYAMVMLLGFGIVYLINQSKKNILLLSILFFLFCQTEVYAVMMVGALLFYLFLEEVSILKNKKIEKLWSQVIQNQDFRKINLSAFIGLIVFIVSVFPRGSEDDLSRAYLSEPFSGETFFKGFQGMFANTFWIGAVPDTNVFGVSGLGMILSLVVLMGMIYFFINQKNILFTLLFFVVGYFVFLITIYTGGVRQWGTFFIFFIMLLALFFGKKEMQKSGLDTIQILFLASILGFQIYYTGLAVQKEYQFPFSNSKLAAEFIQEKVPAEVPIVAINKFEVAPVVGYAGRDFYALPEGKTFTYFKWVEKVYLPSEQELMLFADYKKVRGLILISPKPLGATRYPNVKLWKQFDSYNIKNENYFIYTLQK